MRRCPDPVGEADWPPRPGHDEPALRRRQLRIYFTITPTYIVDCFFLRGSNLMDLAGTTHADPVAGILGTGFGRSGKHA